MALLKRKKNSKHTRVVQMREMIIQETSQDNEFQQIKNPADINKMFEKHGGAIAALTDQSSSSGERSGWFGKKKKVGA